MQFRNLIYRLLPFISIFTILIYVQSCESPSQQKQEEENLEYLPDSIDTDGMAEAECLKSDRMICQSGLAFAQLNDSLAWLLGSEIGPKIEENILLFDDIQWLELTMPFENGNIIIEGEFLPTHLPKEAVYNTLINRIRIESSLFHTPEDIHVGSKLEALRALHADSVFQIVPIPDYQTISIGIEGQSYNFLIKDTENQVLADNQNLLDIQSLSGESSIYAIVVM